MCFVVTLTAAHFVCAVPTVVIVVAYVWQGHAVSVDAFKLFQCAGGQCGLTACEGRSRDESSTQVFRNG